MQRMVHVLVVVLMCLFSYGQSTDVHMLNVSEGRSPGVIVSLHSLQDLSGSILFSGLHNVPNVVRLVIEEYFQYEIDGNIAALKTIDRDDIAKRIGAPHEPVVFSINYLLNNGQMPVVTVNVIDVNDNDPMFLNDTQTVEMSEGVIDSQSLQQAVDGDEGTNAIVDYSLVDSLNGLFELSIRRAMGEILELRLENTVPLDHENITEYTLQLIATEGTENPTTATQTLIVLVTDICDISPSFPTTRYLPPPIPENSTAGTVIFTNITAFDADLVDRDGLAYHINEVCRRPELGSPCESVRDGQHPFVLDSEHGQLTLEGELDREEFALYEISVHATDQCARTSSATVVVEVEDVNDNCPNITFASSVIGGKIKETIINLPITVGFFTVTDEDSGSNGRFSVELYEMVDGQMIPSETFRLDSRTAPIELDLIQRVDREVRSEYPLVIVATDYGTPRCTSTLRELLVVEDFNDNPPVIVRDLLQPVYEIEEERPVNFNIVTIEATDADDYDTGNGMVTFHLPESDFTFPYQHLFEIERETGILKVAGRLDRELYQDLHVLVVASDNPLNVSNRRDPVLNDSVIVNITLRDIDDNMPLIHYPIGVFEVRENPAVTRVFTINATDSDSTPSFSTLTYSISPSSSPFVVDMNTGEVFSEGALDYETTQEYSVTIRVSDSRHTTEVVLTIAVVNINDEHPEFEPSSQSVSVNIRENMPSGFHVATINATDPDISGNPRVEIESGNERGHFEIDEVSGLITTTTPLNKETVVNYTLIIRANDGVHYSLDHATVIVNVLDINDNSPEFYGAPYHFRVDEEIQANTPVEGPTEILATDIDTGVNQQITYSITGFSPSEASEWFKIDPDTGRIRTKQRLDREHSALGPSGEVRLSVRASNPPIDGASPFSDEAEVTITIVDINDQSPFFEEPTFTIPLPENFIIGSVFHTVEAIDHDQPPNNEITYEITPVIVQVLIDRTSGALTLSSSLDHETQDRVEFQVWAYDAHERSRFATQTIIINVTDTGDPCLQWVSSETAVSLPENSPPNTEVLTLEAVNLDGETVTTVEYTLSPSVEFAIIENDNFQATIHTATMNINREALVDEGNSEATYTLTIVAHDRVSSLECNNITRGLTVTITDVNDNAPMFSSSLYEFNITENLPSKTAGTVVARDSDDGSNSEISFSIDGTVPFTVSANGEIRSTRMLNRDPPTGEPQYTFSVIARDNGDEPMSSSASVTVNVLDENDNDPVFDRNQNLTFVVSEDTAIGESIATIRVTDNDSGKNGQVTISLNQGSALDPHFSISDGTIILEQPLDRETEDAYSFEVRASDVPGRSATEEINIVVSDVNDNPPIFELEPLGTIRVPENPVDRFVTQFVANDKDIGLNADIRYQLQDRTYDETFCLDSRTGRLEICADPNPGGSCGNLGPSFPVSPLDFERQASYELTVLAYDQARPRHFASKTIRIEVINKNEHVPIFDLNPVVVGVDEGLNIGDELIRIEAYDWDHDSLTYSVNEDGELSSNFRYQNGAIISSTSINYNTHSEYRLTLTAKELNTDEEYSATTTVIVYVRNINNHHPVFDTTVYPTSTEVLESTQPGSIVLTVHADDADNATHDAVSYQIMNGNEGDVFRIDSLTGDLIVQSHLDYDSVQSYSLTVVAVDTGPSQLTSTALELHITIQNINDESPIFTSDIYRFNYTENSPVGTTVGQVEAPDRDLDPFRNVRYSLSEDNAYFEVDSMTGDVRSRVMIDREMADFSSQTLTVLATDFGSPQTDTAQVIISLLDANDNSPEFSDYQYYLYETQNLQPGVSIRNLANEVSDIDLGDNAEVTFEVVPQSSLTVSSTGDVMLSVSPESGVKMYEAEVNVFNTFDRTRFDTAYVRLAIEGENDHHPRFDQRGGYSAPPVSEDTMRGTLVYDVSDHVFDTDSGSNGELSYQFQEAYSHFSIDSTSGHVILAESLDFEATKSYSLRVAAVDGNSRTAETMLTVTVTSVNDNSPVFDDYPDRLVLSPIPGSDIDLFTLSASDDDEGPDGIVSYSLRENGVVSASFDIDSELGVVRSKGPIVAGGTYTLTVTAFDSGSPPRSQDAVIRVDIQQPSIRPVFQGLQTPQVIEVEEYSTRNTLYEYRTQPQATGFRIVYTNASNGLFSVSKSQGFLLLQGTLDYLREQRYRLIVEAYIEDTTNLDNIIRSSSYQEVVINVIDVNNNIPQFVFQTHTVSISENEDVGQVIFKAEALDDDSGIFGELNYEITNSNPSFTINRTSGEVTLSGGLDRETHSSYDLNIRAFDLSSTPNFGEMTLHIDVQDVNDFRPRFVPEGNRSISVYEHPHTRGGDRIIRLAAVDLDEGPPLRYFLFLEEVKFRGTAVSDPPLNPFSIHLDTGMISLGDSVQLDFEATDYYLLRVEATDSVTTAITYLEVNVLDVNDYSPVFMSIPNHVDIHEKSPVGTRVAEIVGRDSDQSINGVVTYSLGEGWNEYGEDVFVIDPYTGVIRINKPFVARMDLHTFTGTVHITDQGVPPSNASQFLPVLVLEVSDMPPRFDSESYVFSASVSAPTGSPVGKFNVTDSDLGEHLRVNVRIPDYYSEANDFFSVSSSLFLRKYVGDIRTNNHGLEAKNYTFRLEAENPSFSPNCAPYRQVTYADVTIVVYPDCPYFNRSIREYTVEVEEEQFSSDVLLQLSATSHAGRQVEYSFRDPDEVPFTIDRYSGQLTLASALDRETQENYDIYISATDSIFQPHTCSALVRVTVLDINDNTPTFILDSDEYQFSVLENEEAQAYVGTVIATDDDTGANGAIHFELAESYADVPFTVNRQSGKIFASTSFDAESTSSFRFEVRAVDGGDEQRTGSVFVTVTIDDVNDSEPTFSEQLYTFPDIGPDTPAGAVIGKVTAEDLDQTAELSYYFVNDEPKQYFEINSRTGEIILRATSADSSSIVGKRSIQKRQTDGTDGYFTVEAVIEVSDGVNNVTSNAEFSLHNSFRAAEPVNGPDETLMIIIVVVASVVAVLSIFLTVLVIACVCTRKSRQKVKINDSRSVPDPNEIQLSRFNSKRSQGSRSSTPGQNRYTTTTNVYSQGHIIHHSSGSTGSNSSRQSYCNSADDELDSTNGDIIKRSAYNSPGLSKRQANVNHAVHARSTSDLASSVGTDILGSQQLPHPKAKIDAIYAAHQELLNNHGSRESIHSNHTFASEGGGEADAEDDIHAMLTSKYEFEDDDDDITTIPDDASYMGKDPHLPDSTRNLDIPPVEEDRLPRYPYSQPTESEWAPRGIPMDQNIDEIHEMASYSSSQDHHIPSSRYREPSQAVSMYGASSQGSRISLLRHHGHHAPRGYDLPPHMGQPPPTYDYEYYRHPQESRQTRDRSHPRSYGSASALQDYSIAPPRDYPHLREPRPDHHHHQTRGHPAHMMFSQEVPPTYPYLPHGGNLQTPSSETPTDGTVTPSRAMGQEYDHGEYMSSSSTSLGSTNLSGTTSSIGASVSQRIYAK